MIVVAGPPGAGKSTAFPVSEFGVDHFNADDVAAVLNGGSYAGIPPPIRDAVNREFERFVYNHVLRRRSFAMETTLRTDVTFEEARAARRSGFETILFFVGLSPMREAIRRIKIRASAGAGKLAGLGDALF